MLVTNFPRYVVGGDSSSLTGRFLMKIVGSLLLAGPFISSHNTLVSANATAPTVPKDTNFLSITDDELHKLLETHPKGVFVKFTVPWSVRCQSFAPVFRNAAKLSLTNPKLNELEITVPFVEIDLTQESGSDLSRKYGIRGFPTLIFFDGHEARYEFEGSPDEHAMIEFVGHMATPVLQPTMASLNEELAVSLYAPPTGSAATVEDERKLNELKNAFTRLAKDKRSAAYWHYTSAETAHDARVEVLHRGEPKRTFYMRDIPQGAMDETEMRKFFMSNNLPTFGVMDRGTFGHYAEKPIVWVLPELQSSSPDHFLQKMDEIRPMILEVSEKLLKEDDSHVKFNFVAANTYDFAQVLNAMFNVNSFPAVVAQKRSGDREYWLYDGEVSELLEKKQSDKLQQFLMDVGSGKMERTIKSEPIPDYEPEPGEPFVIVGKNLGEKAFQADRDVLLNVFAPWCGHCKNFSPEFRKVARKVHLLNMQSKIYVAQIDGTANEASVPELSWDGFPTIVFIKAGTREVLSYNHGNREASEVYKWVRQHSTYQQNLEPEMGEVKLDL